MQNEIFAFTNWWALAFGAVLLAVLGLAIIITLRLLKGPTPKEVSTRNMFYNSLETPLNF